MEQRSNVRRNEPKRGERMKCICIYEVSLLSTLFFQFEDSILLLLSSVKFHVLYDYQRATVCTNVFISYLCFGSFCTCSVPFLGSFSLHLIGRCNVTADARRAWKYTSKICYIPKPDKVIKSKWIPIHCRIVLSLLFFVPHRESIVFDIYFSVEESLIKSDGYNAHVLCIDAIAHAYVYAKWKYTWI